jgi:hypothetical protein
VKLCDRMGASKGQMNGGFRIFKPRLVEATYRSTLSRKAMWGLLVYRQMREDQMRGVVRPFPPEPTGTGRRPPFVTTAKGRREREQGD